MNDRLLSEYRIDFKRLYVNLGQQMPNSSPDPPNEGSFSVNSEECQPCILIVYCYNKSS